MSLSYDQFVKKYLGKATEWDTTDGVSTVQCVDLAKLYLYNCFGIKAKPWTWGNAVDYYTSFNNKSWGGYTKMHDANFVRIANTPSFVPMKGDIVIWTGKYGHIAIATGEGNTSKFYSYDQNWNGKAMKKVCHTYTDFLGVLRPPRKVKAALNVRKGAGTNYEVVDEIKKGTLVTIYEYDKTKKWGRIGTNKWVSLNYVKEL